MFIISEVVPFIVELAQGNNLHTLSGLGHDAISGKHPNLYVHSGWATLHDT